MSAEADAAIKLVVVVATVIVAIVVVVVAVLVVVVVAIVVLMMYIGVTAVNRGRLSASVAIVQEKQESFAPRSAPLTSQLAELLLRDCKSAGAEVEEKEDGEEDDEEDGRGTAEPAAAACDCHH